MGGTIGAMAVSGIRRSLMELIDELAFKENLESPFTLASGKQSPYYLNVKAILLSREGLMRVADWIKKGIDDLKTPEGPFPVLVGGMEIGAVPIASAISYSYPVDSFIVRKTKKGHGTMAVVEGLVGRYDDVIIVEDVVTTGGSTLKAIQAVEALGANVVGIFCVVDREDERTPGFEEYHDRLRSFTTLSKFIKWRSGRHKGAVKD